MNVERQDVPASQFVSSRSPLWVGDAAAAIILIEDGRYLLQLRDDIGTIWYPGHWGCFGGGLEEGEDPITALRRELHEELALDLKEARFFTEITFDLAGLGLGRYFRKYFLIQVSLKEIADLRLGEGAAAEAFHGDTILGKLKVSPYDAFAIFLHARAFRIGGSGRNQIPSASNPV